MHLISFLGGREGGAMCRQIPTVVSSRPVFVTCNTAAGEVLVRLVMCIYVHGCQVMFSRGVVHSGYIDHERATACDHGL